MHKATFLEGTLHFSITPDGPILIKAGDTGGADPTLPDMEFVRTRRRGSAEVYLPGSSLKGVIRAHCERICRSLDVEGRDPRRDNPPLADNPLGRGDRYSGLNDMDYNSGQFLEKEADTATIYRRSALTSQMFGSTALAGRIRFADAYAREPVNTEERNGVAIDRIYGSVAVGPFNYETAVDGEFVTSINFRNLTLAQLGLLGLALRDLADGRVAIGFGKSRGLGRVSLNFASLELFYPTCELSGAELRLLNGSRSLSRSKLAGIGALCADSAYGFDAPDAVDMPEGLAYQADEDYGIGVRLHAGDADQVRALFRACMPAWRRRIGL